MERFCQITLPGAVKSIYPESHLVSVFFSERELIDDRGVGCIVLEEWQHESVFNNVSMLPKDNAKSLAERAENTMREFMELGWQVDRVDEYLFINRDKGEIVIDMEGLSRAPDGVLIENFG
jgi:hypothetical protein